MEKTTRTFNVNYDLCWDWQTEIAEIKKDIENLEKLGATHINIEANMKWGDPFTEIEAVSIREETNNDVIDRVKKAAKREAEQKRIAMVTYNDIKAKYNL